ncbi:hypothetical protein EP331_05870 [bacterium]|nr:MAG: hypothetical protein EP331_05870 [bacterium]
MSVKHFFSTYKFYVLAYFFLGIGFLFFPLIRNLNLESAAIISLIAAFLQIKTVSSQSRFINSHLVLPLLSAVPLFVSDVFKGCFDVSGSLFWLSIPITSVLLAQSIVRICFRYTAFPKTVSALLLLFISVILPGVEFLNSPVVYLYNPIWAYWPGPIYDEQLRFPTALIIYRFYILIWAVLLHELQRTTIDIKRVLLFFITLSVLFINFRSLGIIRTSKELASELKGLQFNKNIYIHYDSSFIDSTEIAFLVKETRFHWDELQLQWNTVDEKPIQIFLYNHPWQKKELTGAKYTQYTPVWLDDHQIHIDYLSFRGVIRHELAHLLAKNWSNNLIHANWNMGLVEGLATASDPDVSSNLTLQEFVAAGGSPGKEEMKDLFSFFGFYTRSSSNAYYKTGAFIQFMEQNEEYETVKSFYAGNWDHNLFENTFNKWQEYQSAILIDSTEKKQAQLVFARPSLFEKSCPRKISPGYQLYDLYQKAVAESDSVAQNSILNNGIELSDSTWNSWFRYQKAIRLLKSEETDSVFALLNTHPDTRSLLALYDYFLVIRQSEKADSIKTVLIPKISETSSFWDYRNTDHLETFLQLVYKHNPEFALASSSTLFHALLIDFVIQTKDTKLTQKLTTQLMQGKPDFDYIRAYLRWAHYLWMNQQKEAAKLFLSKLELASDREQHRYLIQREYRLVTGY